MLPLLVLVFVLEGMWLPLGGLCTPLNLTLRGAASFLSCFSGQGVNQSTSVGTYLLKRLIFIFCVSVSLVLILFLSQLETADSRAQII